MSAPELSLTEKIDSALGASKDTEKGETKGELEGGSRASGRGRGGRGRGRPRGKGGERRRGPPKRVSGVDSEETTQQQSPPGDRVSVARSSSSSKSDRQNKMASKRGSCPSAKVAAGSDIKGVAGYVANSIREHSECDLLAAGPSSVNQAVKTVCLARQYLAEECDLYAQPVFHGTEEMPASNEVNLTVTRCEPFTPPEEQTALNVAGSSTPNLVAGAIANAVREGESVVVFAMGPQAVTRALKAVWRARAFLEDDQLDLRVVPEFKHGEGNETFSTKIALHIQSYKLEPEQHENAAASA